MSKIVHLSRRFRWIALLRASLVLGALYDAGFAGLMLLAPRWTAARLGVPLPEPAFYLPLLAVLLLMLAALYLLAAGDPERHLGTVAVAIGGRLAGAFVLGWWAARGLPPLWPLAAGDLAFAVAHAVFWLPWRE